ncbi:MAG: hypothetical protein Q9195_001605 [Heterodermia aff. obscurata]
MAEAAGLALAVIPLIISALENYENVLEPFIIFRKKYKEEVEKFQYRLRIQKLRFDNECGILLGDVTGPGHDIVANHDHWWWQDPMLGIRLKNRLDDNYEICVLALGRIRTILEDILKESKTLEILQQKKRWQGLYDREWLRHFRRRSKISFSKARYDDKLRELTSENDRLQEIRMAIERFQADSKSSAPGSSLVVPIKQFRAMQYASCKLYETLSSVWRCETPREHFANVSLDEDISKVSPHDTSVLFNMVWSCPTHHPSSGRAMKELRLSVKAFSEAPGLAANVPPANSQQNLKAELTATIQPDGSRNVSVRSATSSSGINTGLGTSASIRDLCVVPNLCQHLGQRVGGTESPHCVGYLQKTKTFKHVIYTSNESRLDNPGIKTFEEALNVAKAHDIEFTCQERVQLSTFLAQALLRFHSTPWLPQHWRSRDVVFYDINDFLEDRLLFPYLKARISTSSPQGPQSLVAASGESTSPNQSPIRNQLLFDLGVMLVELAYGAPLQELKEEEDDHGDPLTLYRTATRLCTKLNQKCGPAYEAAARVCLRGTLGGSCDLHNSRTLENFYVEVVQRLRNIRDDFLK